MTQVPNLTININFNHYDELFQAPSEEEKLSSKKKKHSNIKTQNHTPKSVNPDAIHNEQIKQMDKLIKTKKKKFTTSNASLDIKHGQFMDIFASNKMKKKRKNSNSGSDSPETFY